MFLKSAMIEVEPKKSGRKQFNITFKTGGGVNMLVEAESEDVADEWVTSLREHVAFSSHS